MRTTWSLVHKLINPFNPLVECALAFGGGGVKPFIDAVFKPSPFLFFNTSEEGGDKNLQFQAWHNNSNVKERCKSLCIQAWHLNSNIKGGDKKCLA